MRSVVISAEACHRMIDGFAMMFSVHATKGKRNPTVLDVASHFHLDLLVAIEFCRVAFSVENSKYDLANNGEIKIRRVA